ncbi:MAG: hypothetical protein ACTS73_02320 [Arsenophonus sp. NEOnobi-MAG3]
MKSLAYKYSPKLDITSDSFHKLIHNSVSHLIEPPPLRLILKPCCNNMLKAPPCRRACPNQFHRP